MILFTAVLSLHQENLNKTSTKCGVVWCGVVVVCGALVFLSVSFQYDATPHHTTLP